jgi:hypothetical protein
MANAVLRARHMGLPDLRLHMENGPPPPPHDGPGGGGPWASVTNLIRSAFERIQKLEKSAAEIEARHRAELASLQSRIDNLFVAAATKLRPSKSPS